MVEISGSPIKQIFNAGVDFIKTVRENARKGVSQFSSSFVDKCRNITASMSNSFFSVCRSVKQVF